MVLILCEFINTRFISLKAALQIITVALMGCCQTMYSVFSSTFTFISSDLQVKIMMLLKSKKLSDRLEVKLDVVM